MERDLREVMVIKWTTDYPLPIHNIFDETHVKHIE